jgi:hypothetical protein
MAYLAADRRPSRSERHPAFCLYWVLRDAAVTGRLHLGMSGSLTLRPPAFLGLSHPRKGKTNCAAAEPGSSCPGVGDPLVDSNQALDCRVGAQARLAAGNRGDILHPLESGQLESDEAVSSRRTG